MAQTDLAARADDDLKTSGDAPSRSLGMSYAAVVNAMIKQAARQGGRTPPFDLGGRGRAGAAGSEDAHCTDMRRRMADLDAGMGIVYANPPRASADAD
jgi:hypothetical protein